jgi:hypothetical protein
VKVSKSKWNWNWDWIKKLKFNPLTFLKKHLILTNCLAILVAAVLLVFGVFWWLDGYTRHGESLVVPDVCGLDVKNATSILAGKEMQCVVIDSVYIPEKHPGIIVEQSPQADALVKSGRRIYVIVNAMSAQMVVFPDVVDMSLRQATVQIEGANFKIKEIKYEPSSYKDLVLSVEYKGKEVKVAQKLPYRSEVILHVGQGDDYEEMGDSIVVESAVDVAIEEALFGDEF